MNQKPTIQTQYGKGIVEEVYVTDLNFLMIKVQLIGQGRWIRLCLGKNYNESDNIFSNALKAQE